MGDALADEVTDSLRRALAAIERAVVRTETTLPALRRLAALPATEGIDLSRPATEMLEEAEARLERLHERRLRVLDRMDEREAATARGENP